MTRFSWQIRGHKIYRRLAIVVLLSVAAAFSATPRLAADGLADQAQSLRLVPADASFYSANLRIKEQWNLLLNSKAYAKLMEIPVIQIVKMQVMFQWQGASDPSIAQVKEYIESPEGRDLLAVGKEMLSEEAFSYGSSDFVEFLKVMMRLNSVQRQAQLEAMNSDENEMEIMGRHLLELFEENAEGFKVPDIVTGFRVEDVERARAQLGTVKSLLADTLQENAPEMVDRLSQETIGRGEFVTLRLDGSLLPWDEVRSGVEDLDEEQFQKWKTLLSSKTMVVAIGVIDNFVILSIGDSTDHISNLGEGAALGDEPAIARLEQHADQRVTSIAFTSKEFLDSVNSPHQQLDDLVNMADQVLQVAEIDPETKEELISDIKTFGEDVANSLPEGGDLSVVSFMTPRGYESFQYNWGSLPSLDDSQALKILNHVGGEPMAFAASQHKSSDQDYNLFVDWVKRFADHGERLVKEKLEDEQLGMYEQYKEKVVELLERWDKANREMILPALAEGQNAVVVDVKAASKQWQEKMPPSSKPLPMLELGIVVGVSDPALLRKGVQEYFDITQDAIKLLHEAMPDQFPEIALPEPEVKDVSSGTLYTYRLPNEWGLDSQLAPNGGVSETAAAVSAFPAFTERLLRPTPLALESPLADSQRPLAMMAHFDIAKLIDTIRPWVDYGFSVFTGELTGEDDDRSDEDKAAAQMQAGFVLPQIQQLLDVIKALDCYTSVTYFEEETWVTHAELHLVDLQ